MNNSHNSQFFRVITILFLFVIPVNICFAQTGVIQGRVKDAQTGNPLPGANILIKGTSIGAATDIEGNYRIINVPVGRQNIVFSFVGYKSDTVAVNVLVNKTLSLNETLSPSTILGKTVVVTGQLAGQAAAINQQLSSQSIVNVVSSERIKALPDNNAAESVGRLPGIAILRSNGEAQKITIRGLDPKYTMVMVNGQVVPATSSSDRSVDLSMIPSDELEGIEVFKSITPDMPADAIAGIVNFTTPKAQRGLHGTLDARGGYNKIGNETRQYNFAGNLSDRFFNNELGAIVTASIQNQPWPTNGLNVSYGLNGYDPNTGAERLQVNTLTLADKLDTRTRYGGSVALDYEPDPNNTIKYYTLFSRKNSSPLTYEKEYDVSGNKLDYRLQSQKSFKSMWSNNFVGQHLLFNILQTDWALGGARTTNDEPQDYEVSFLEMGGMTGGLPTQAGINMVPEYAKNNLSQTYFNSSSANSSVSKETDWNGKLNFKYPFSLSDFFSGYLKAGGYFRGMQRTYYNVGFAQINQSTLSAIMVKAHPEYQTFSGSPIITNFLDPGFNAGNFLDGQFAFPVGVQKNLAQDLFNTYPSGYVANVEDSFNDYTAFERVYAGYLMTSINITNNFNLIGGARYESTHNNYDGTFADLVSQNQVGQFVNSRDTSAIRIYDDWLPMVLLKYNIISNLSVRAAYTNTLSRPNYSYLVPTTVVSREGRSMSTGNPSLNEAKSRNYDLVFTYYSGLTGLFSVDGFYKKISNISYMQNSVIHDQKSQYFGYSLSMPVNALHASDVYGFEVDLQTNFRFLPDPFDGIILDVNYTRLYGATYFPVLKQVIGPPPYYQTQLIPSERKGPVPGMSNHIANISLGYGKGNFSGRISAIYQSNILTGVGTTSAGDTYQKGFVRLDAIASYKLIDGITLYWDMNNLNSMVETSFVYNEGHTTSENHYKWTMDLGAKYNF